MAWERATAAHDRAWGADHVRTQRTREILTREYLAFCVAHRIIDVGAFFFLSHRTKK